MYAPMALIASFLVWNKKRQISNDLIVLKTVSTSEFS
jgi:hypothetical protein